MKAVNPGPRVLKAAPRPSSRPGRGSSSSSALDAILPEQAAKVVILRGTVRDGLDQPLLEIVGPRFVEKPAALSEIEIVLDGVFRAHARAA